MSSAAPTPEVIFEQLFAYQQTAALKTAIDLDLFTAVDEGARSVGALAGRTRASERGTRILCDYLTTLGLLDKAGESYTLTPVAAAFLSRTSPTWVGSVATFLTLPQIKSNFENLTETVRTGTVRPDGNTVAAENPIWLDFARGMVPLAMPAAHTIAGLLQIAAAGPQKVLDIAAGHGMYGIVLAQLNSHLEVAAVDWPAVLNVAQEHARAAGVAERFRKIPGDAFSVDFGSGYDVVLVTNFLHHFDETQCTRFLTKVHAALKPGGRVVLVEFVPNPDRVSPPMVARFSLAMLAGTPSGDAYTLEQLNAMLRAAGFGPASAHPTPTPQTVVIATK